MASSSGSFAYMFKYIIIGDSSCGKSCLLLRFCDRRFTKLHETTIGVEFGTRIVSVEGKSIKLQVWDTAGQEQYRSITRSFYRGAAVALLVYDVSREKTFRSLESWIEDCVSHSPNVHIVLVGNKTDKEKREVSTEQGRAFAELHGIDFIETSAKSDTNVDEAFIRGAQTVLQKIKDGKIDLRSESDGVRVNQANPNIDIRSRNPSSSNADNSKSGGCKC